MLRLTTLSFFASLNLAQFIQHHHGSIIDYGSEFQDVHLLSKIYSQHPTFPNLSEDLLNGMSYKFVTELNEDQCLQEVQASLQYGNHKLATNNQSLFDEYIAKDVKFVFALLINKTAVIDIPKFLVQPGGLAK